MNGETRSGRVLLLASSPRMLSAARLLSEVLLRPGVSVIDIRDSGTIGSEDVVLAFDRPSETEATRCRPRLVVGLRSGESARGSIDCRLPGGEVVVLPDLRVEVEVENGFRRTPNHLDRARSMLLMALRRHAKSSHAARRADRMEAEAAIEFLARSSGVKVAARLAEAFVSAGIEPVREDWMRRYRDSLEQGTTPDERLDEVEGFVAQPDPERFPRFRSLFLADPVLLVLASMAVPVEGRADWCRFLELIEGQSATGRRRTAVLGAAMLVDAEGLFEAVLASLGGTSWSFEDSALLRLAPDRSNIERSLLAAFVHVAVALRHGIELDSLLPQRLETPLEWRGFGSKAIDEGVEPSTMRFYDPGRGRLASDLIENWLLLMEQRTPASGQFEIQPDHYSGGIEAIEHLLGCIVDDLQIRASGRAIRLRPWPAGCDFALSIRYDVDRPVSSARVSELAELQRRRCGDECGSWFMLTDAGHSAEVASSLAGTDQEIGRHACDLDRDSFAGEGVTVHSSQWSRYWEGRRSIEAIEAGNADYGESMQFTACTARRAWLGSGAASVWCTPLHFPLEGTVDQADLAYFDRQRTAFDRLRRQGGHLIIGAHPDCEPSLLESLLDRIDLDRVWVAPIGRVVDRVRSLGRAAGVQVRFSGDQVEARVDWPIDGLLVEVEDANGVKTYSAPNLVAEWRLLCLEGAQEL